VRALCKQFNLRLQRHRYSYFFPNNLKPAPFYPANAHPFSPRADRALRAFLIKYLNPKRFDLCDQKLLDKYDWWTWLGNLGFTRNELLRRDLMDSTDFGESIRLTSAYVAAGEYAGSNDTDEMDWKITGGNQQLPRAIVNRIRGTGLGSFHRNRRATEIYQKNEAVEVHAEFYPPDARRPSLSSRHKQYVYKADFCICAIPARVLNDIRWFPALPEEQSQAADELQYCRITKTAILYPRRFWSKPSKNGFAIFTDGVSDFCFDSTQRQPGPQGILCSYAVGDKADDIDAATKSDMEKWITDDTLLASGKKKGSLKAINSVHQSWQKNPFTKGAYAFYRSGQWFTVRPLLARPHARVHFAGEHLDEDWQGFMEGAVRTGEDAAARL
jgi:monoamine oxidase